MTNRVITKVVRLVGSWREDVVTDGLLKDIANTAETEKGKKRQIRIDDKGIKLTRFRLLEQRRSVLFQTKSIYTVTRSVDFPKCVLIILSDPEKKYKIVAIRCQYNADAAEITSAFAAVQKKVQLSNIEFKKREDGNWTLSGRVYHNANMQLKEIFNDQPNGGVMVENTNAGTSHTPELAPSNHHNLSYDEDVYIKQEPIKMSNSAKKKDDSSSSSSDDDDGNDYVIETEVTNDPYYPEEVYAEPHRKELKEVTSRFEHVAMKEHPAGIRVYGKPSHTPHVLTKSPSLPSVYSAVSPPEMYPQPLVYSPPWMHYQPVIMANPHAGYYPDPWSHVLVPREPPWVQMRVHPNRLSGKLDQQSMTSKSSKKSRHSKTKSSDHSIPTTVQRPIENVYHRPIVYLPRGSGNFSAYRPRPASYYVRPNDLQVYPEDEGVHTGILM